MASSSGSVAVAVAPAVTVGAPARLSDDRPARHAFALAEDGFAIAILALMTAIPLVETTGRATLGHGVPGAIVIVQQLTLWIALVGAALAARSDRLLALSTPKLLGAGLRARVQVLTGAVAAGISAVLCAASLDLTLVEQAAGGEVAWGIPSWVMLLVLPIGFATIAIRLAWHAATGPGGRALAAAGLLVPLLLWWSPALAHEPRLVLAAGVAIGIATLLGMPIFAAIGGVTLLFLWADGTPLNAVPSKAYSLTTSPMLAAIPLFALSGYILAEGGSSHRLTRLFTALFGWMPGGLAIVTTAVLAFFTPLTGASGITIVSMGGLLLPVLREARYPASTSLGLVTVSGSIGLLFFPSLPVFLYGFYANVPFDKLFIGGLLPGILLVAVVAGWAGVRGWAAGTARTPFHIREAARATWEARWEILLPVVMLGGILGGWATLVEAAAISVLYALVIECAVHRGLSLSRDVPHLAVECATLVGGFMVILSVAVAFTNFLVLAEIPTQLLAWVQAHVTSPIVFLLALNVLLIVVGALMDIYSSIVIVVPLIAPVAAAYGIDPVHLGIIFLANMELGYLMPPMGENLFLSSYRFERPLTEVYRSTLPYSVLLLIVVLLVTYVPWLTLWLVNR